jgi:glycosyltransferase involved in cell wall biosynthesis
VAEERARAVYNGIPREFGRGPARGGARARFGIPAAAVAVAIVGAVSERKGLAPLLEALAGIGPGEVDWRLYVAGDGPDRGRFEARTDSLGLRDRVRFVGTLAPPDVERLLVASDLVAVPSFVEGLPYVILEAMACALPVVASDIYGVAEAAPHGDTALLVPPGDVDALRQALLALMLDPDRRRELGARARARFEAMFTLDRHIARIEAVYLELLAGGRLEERV